MGDRVRVATGNGAGAPPHCHRRARVHPAKAQAGRECDARPGRASTPSATAWHEARVCTAPRSCVHAGEKTSARMCSPHLGARACAARRVGASPLSASTQPHRIPRRRHAHSAHQPCGLGALDAGCKVPGPRRLRSRSASSRGPAEARSPVSAADPARARRRRGLPRKKWLKFSTLFPPTAKGGAARGEAHRRKKWRTGG